MTKPCSVGTTGLKTEANKIQLFLIAVLFTSQIYSQIPINGFCKYSEFSCQPGMTKLLALNYNNDSYTDLFLYNPTEKKASIFNGASGVILGSEKKINLSIELSKIKPMFDRHSRVTGYGFTSRKNKKAGVINFRNSGYPYIQKEIKFDAYPENITAASIERTGGVELVVSGSAFPGIAMLSPRGNFRFEVSYIDKNSVYPHAVFSDLSNDGNYDIAAYNLLRNTIEFFYNLGEKRFNNARTIKLDEKINSLYAFDLNLDSYEDLIFVQKNRINFLYGDSVSSFQNSGNIKTTFHPDKVIQGDFNRDGLIDIAYLNSENGILSIIFAAGDYSFHDEMVYIAEKGLSDIIPFYSKFLSGIAAVNLNGSLKIISNLNGFSDGVDMVFSPRPSALNYFDHNNNGIYDIVYIDEFNRSLNFITRNNAGIPQKFYSYNLHSNYKSIAVDDNTDGLKIIYCYTSNEKLIEVIKVNFNSNKFSGNVIYAPGNIEDLKLQKEPDQTEAVLYLSYKQKKSAGTAYYRHKDFRYIASNYNIAEKNYKTGNLCFTTNPALYYWQYDGGNYSLSNYFIGKTEQQNRVIFKMQLNEIFSVNSFTGDLTGNETNITAAFFYNDEKSFTQLVGTTWTRKIESNKNRKAIKINTIEQIYFGETQIGGIKKLNIYDAETKNLFRFDFIKDGKNFITTSLGETPGLKSYFIKNMSSRNYHIVYTNGSNNALTVKQVSK
ncbi:MAG: VCBS repeat-containing protein [Ignavibacteriaceae bacterium]|nr:VCBS repeat-containing protein [Ignavibacteriaceae bacterium]